MLLLSSQVITRSEGAQGTQMFVAHLSTSAALLEAFKKLPPCSNIEFLDYGNARGEEEGEKGLLRLHGSPRKKTGYFVLSRDATVRRGLSTEFPVLM